MNVHRNIGFVVSQPMSDSQLTLEGHLETLGLKGVERISVYCFFFENLIQFFTLCSYPAHMNVHRKKKCMLIFLVSFMGHIHHRDVPGIKF